MTTAKRYSKKPFTTTNQWLKERLRRQILLYRVIVFSTECQYDVDRFLREAFRRGLIFHRIIVTAVIFEDGFETSDRWVVLEGCQAILQDIRAIFNDMTDSHVMLRSLKQLPKAENQVLEKYQDLLSQKQSRRERIAFSAETQQYVVELNLALQKNRVYFSSQTLTTNKEGKTNVEMVLGPSVTLQQVRDCLSHIYYHSDAAKLLMQETLCASVCLN
jgi:hypothetical protein